MEIHHGFFRPISHKESIEEQPETNSSDSYVTQYESNNYMIITPLEKNPPDELLCKSEIAKRLKLSERTIENLTNKGLIPLMKIGNSSRYDWSAVLESITQKQ